MDGGWVVQWVEETTSGKGGGCERRDLRERGVESTGWTGVLWPVAATEPAACTEQVNSNRGGAPLCLRGQGGRR